MLRLSGSPCCSRLLGDWCGTMLVCQASDDFECPTEVRSDPRSLLLPYDLFTSATTKVQSNARLSPGFSDILRSPNVLIAVAFAV